MSTSLIETLSGLITPSLLSRLSSTVGESEASTTKALGAVFPAILAGLAGRTSDAGAMGALEALLRDKSNDSSLLNDVGSLVGSLGSSSPINQLSSRFLSGVFGNQLGPLGSALSQFAGIKSTSASSLLAFAGPLVMGLLGSRLRGGASLASLLNGQRQSFLSSVPAGLASVLGVMSPGSTETPFARPHHQRASGMGWWPFAVGALVLGFLAWNLLAPRTPAVVESTTPSMPAPATEPTPTTSALWPDLGAFARRVLPGNIGELNIPERGIETRLLSFIEGAAAVDTTTWFDFDRILFDTGAATLRTESDEQIGNIAAIMKAFPNVSLKVGGYTDNTGDPGANLKLSQARAEAVMQAVVAKGVEASRLEAEGYGAQHPVADNATEEGRQKNRRVAVRVTKK